MLRFLFAILVTCSAVGQPTSYQDGVIFEFTFNGRPHAANSEFIDHVYVRDGWLTVLMVNGTVYNEHTIEKESSDDE